MTATRGLSPPTRTALLFGGAFLLGVGVALTLLADLGSDGYSMLVHGFSIFSGLPFWLANIIMAAVFLALAALRRVIPGIGTIVQIGVVGVTVNILLATVTGPGGLWARVGLTLVALFVLALGIALYLGANLGAGPMEAAGLAWDPPLPFRWSYSVAQLTTAAVGWLMGATFGLTTIIVIFCLGPLVDLISRRLGLDVRQS